MTTTGATKRSPRAEPTRAPVETNRNAEQHDPTLYQQRAAH
jgi:hypothetical protein